MPMRRTNSLLFCSLVLVLNTSATSQQNDSLNDLLVPSGSHSTQHDTLPTPATPIAKPKYSRNDPFRVFVPPSEPVCCLIPLPSSRPDPHPADDLLSFEEWKQRQLALNHAEGQRQAEANAPLPPEHTHGLIEHPSVPAVVDGTLVPVIDTSDTSSVRPRPVVDFTPLEDRFNYASLDCSARVHGTHKSMKSSNSILSSKKDKYMLAPCSAEKKYVVVELCDEIRVDTVQLANFEFFSGVFKDITITLAHTANIDGSSSEIMGFYEAKNVRTIQTFQPFKRPHGFYRFIRIDFHTHYGKEYFCPVSLLRVYGLTQMEEWRMEESEREWQARNQPGGLTISSEPSRTSIVPDSTEDAVQQTTIENQPVQTEFPEFLQDVDELSPGLSSAPNSGVVTTASGNTGEPGTNCATLQTGPRLDHTGTEDSTGAPHISNHARHPVSASSNTTEAHPTTADVHSKSNHAKVSRTKISSLAPTPATGARVTHVASPLPSNSGGESIYRTIMNRLDMLEHNSSLSLRYVEEQNYSVRQALRRLEEEVGRLRALTGQQQQDFQRSMRNVEKKQAEMEKRWDALLEQVNTLAEEARLRVVLEKRLGIAQLCLLTTVLVFMALTRGSRAEAHLLGGVRRRVDSGLGLSRSLHPRNRAQSRPRTAERPFAWARQDRLLTGDTSHQDSGEPPLTPVRSRSPFPTVGTPSGSRGRKVSGTEANSPTGHSSRGVRFPQGLNHLPLLRSGNSLAVTRRRHSLSLSTDQLVPSSGTGKRTAAGVKRLAKTAHLHEVEVEAQRRRRVQGEYAGINNDARDQKSQAAVGDLAASADVGTPRNNDYSTGDSIIRHNSSAVPQALPNPDTLEKQHYSARTEQDNGTDWETDAELNDSGQELI